MLALLRKTIEGIQGRTFEGRDEHGRFTLHMLQFHSPSGVCGPHIKAQIMVGIVGQAGLEIGVLKIVNLLSQPLTNHTPRNNDPCRIIRLGRQLDLGIRPDLPQMVRVARTHHEVAWTITMRDNRHKAAREENPHSDHLHAGRPWCTWRKPRFGLAVQGCKAWGSQGICVCGPWFIAGGFLIQWR